MQYVVCATHAHRRGRLSMGMQRVFVFEPPIPSLPESAPEVAQEPEGPGSAMQQIFAVFVLMFCGEASQEADIHLLLRKSGSALL